MNTPTTLRAFVIVLLPLGACSGSSTLVGQRADGLTVECEDVGDEVYECEPVDGDNECEDWDAGGAAFVLWPPNHKMVAIDAGECLALLDECAQPDPDADPDAEPLVWTVSAVTADEAIDVGAGGDGHTDDFDAFIVDDLHVELRSERQGGGDGRVYRIELTSNLGDTFDCEVHVPHDQGPFGGAVDSGEVVRVEAP